MHNAIRVPSLRVLSLVSVSLLLAACPRPVKPPAPAPSVPPAPALDMRGAAVYDVRPQDSEVHILVYRGGTLSRLGHNHVLSSKALSGRIGIQPQFEKSVFELAFPVRELIIDDPQDRRAAGGDFPPDVPQADKDGTRKNMLKPEVLDGERFPIIKLVSTKVAGTQEAPRITARITIKEASRDVEVPVKLLIEAGRLTATGEFDVLQTDFGIKPFSVVLGALEVQDRLHVKFRVVAEKK